MCSLPRRPRTRPRGAGELHRLTHLKCKTTGRYVNGYSYNWGDSLRAKGKCWHWVTVWVYNFKTKRKYTLTAQGAKEINMVGPTPPGRLATRTGQLIYQLELGLCGAPEKCISKRYQGARI